MDKILSALGEKPWLPLTAPVLVFLVTLYASGSGSPTTFALFVCVSFVCAYFGGLQAGLFATMLSALLLLLQHAFFPPQAHAPHVGDLAFSVLFFLVVGGLASRLSAECHQGLRSATYFQSLLGGLRDAVLVTDGSGHVSFLNGAAESLTGWEGGSAVGRALDAVVHVLEDNRLPMKFSAQLTGKNAAPSGALLLVSRGGTEKHVEYWWEPVPGKSNESRARLVVFRDTGERLRAQKEQQEREEQFRALTGCADSGLLLLNPAGNCIYSNAACQKTGGFTFEDGLGNGWLRFVHPEDRAIAADWMKAANQGKPYTREFRFLGAGGATRWVNLHTAIVRNRGGQCLGHVASLEDVTARKQLEQNLAEQKHAVEALHRNSQEKAQQAQAQIAGFQAEVQRLQQELAELEPTDELRQELTQRQTEWERLEQQLRDEISALTGKHESVRGQLTEGQRKTEDLRRDHTQRQADWERIGAQLREELAALKEQSDGLRRQLADARTNENQSHHHRQTAESELHWRDEAVGRALESLAAGLIVWKGTDALPAPDRVARSLLGLPEGAVPLAQWGQYFDVIEEGATVPGGQASAFMDGLRRQPFRDLELVVAPKAAGAVRTLSVSGTLVHDAHGHEAGFVLALQDVTDDRRATEELRNRHQAERLRVEEERSKLQRQHQFAHSLTANLGESLVAVDGDGVVTFLNPAAEKLLGWSEVDLRGQLIDRILGSAERNGEVLASAEGGLLHTLSPRQVLVKEQVLFRRRDGAVFPAACTVSAVAAENGRLGAVLLIRDMAERLQREGQVRQLGEAGRWADDIVGRLAERVYPELVRMQSSAEELTEAAPEGTWFLESAGTLGKHLQGLSVLFERVAIATRLAREDYVSHRGAVEVSALVGSAVELCAGVLESRRQHLTIYLPLGPEWLFADAGLLRQALMILVENGTEHMEPGGEIELRVERRQEELVFRVRDQGEGIDAEGLSRLQTLCARTRRFWHGGGDGLGIGLAVARSIVELHGGSMTICSEGPRRGSEIALWLPALREQPPRGATPPAAARTDGEVLPTSTGVNA